MKSLTQAKRDQARKRAETSIKKRIGDAPNRSQFDNYVASKYPTWFTRGVGAMLATVALAAGIISGVRLYVAGFTNARDIVPFIGGRILIGVCTFLAAELLVILATVAGQVYLHGRQKGIAAVPVSVGMIVAFVGNWTITDPSSTWGWVETLFPPIAVLSVAFFFEVSLVPELERRQADDREFQRARANWQHITDHFDDHADWWPIFATVLRDELARYNNVSIDDLSPDEWRALVEAEINAEQWWNSADSIGIPRKQAERSKASGKSGGGLVDSVEGNLSQVEKVIEIFRMRPELADKGVTPVSEATDLLGVGNSTYYAAQKAYMNNGHGTPDSDGSEYVQ